MKLKENKLESALFGGNKIVELSEENENENNYEGNYESDKSAIYHSNFGMMKSN